jgi:hypothetical protein
MMWIKLFEFNNGQCVNFEIEGKYITLVSLFATNYEELYHNVEFDLLNETKLSLGDIKLLLDFLVQNKSLIEFGIKELLKK